jgi:hypothetical protein
MVAALAWAALEDGSAAIPSIAIPKKIHVLHSRYIGPPGVA